MSSNIGEMFKTNVETISWERLSGLHVHMGQPAFTTPNEKGNVKAAFKVTFRNDSMSEQILHSPMMHLMIGGAEILTEILPEVKITIESGKRASWTVKLDIRPREHNGDDFAGHFDSADSIDVEFKVQDEEGTVRFTLVALDEGKKKLQNTISGDLLKKYQ